MRHIRMSVIAGAIITILAGIWLFLFPLSSLGTVVHMLGLAVLLYGVVGIATYFMRLGGFWPVGGLTRSVVITAVGLLILSSPGFIISIFPILAGIVIAAGGVDNLLLALAVRKAGGEWVVLLAMGGSAGAFRDYHRGGRVPLQQSIRRPEYAGARHGRGAGL